MPQRIMGIDVGFWSVKGVLLEDSLRGYRVEGAWEVPIADGDDASWNERIAAALAALVAERGSKVDAYVTALRAEEVAVRLLSFPYRDSKKIAQTIAGELADTVPFDVEEAAISHATERMLEDRGALVAAAVAPKPVVTSHLERMASADADPKHVCVDVVSLQNLYSHFLRSDSSAPLGPTQMSEDDTQVAFLGGERRDARLIIDIGHTRTLMVAASDEGVEFARVVRLGGREMTRAIAQHLHISDPEAQELKHAEGFIVSTRHPASTEAQAAISDALEEVVRELVRELRRSIKTIEVDGRVRVGRVDVLGGGARVRNLVDRLADELELLTVEGVAAEQAIERWVESARRPAFALALALALRAAGDERVQMIDFRTGEFQFTGQMLYLRERLPFIGLSAAGIAALVLVNVGMSYHQIIQRERKVDQEFCRITKEVANREICEPKEAISVLKQPGGELGNIRLPERSALNIAAELSARAPKDVEIVVDKLEISPAKAKLTGETTTFEAVESLKAEYEKDKCYSGVRKGDLRRTSDGTKVEFEIMLSLECS